MLGQLTDHGIPPLGPLQLAADVSTDLPIQFYQSGIDRLNGLLPGTVNQRKHFIETVIGCAAGNGGSSHSLILEDEVKRELKPSK
jgi:hypothetical protein